MSMNMLFSEEELPQAWEEHWWQMPEFSHEDLAPKRQLIVSFATDDEVALFSEVIQQKITNLTRSVWFKAQPLGVYRDKTYE